MVVPPEIVFWGFLMAYSVHVVEEAVVGGGFVRMVQDRFWPAYTDHHFFRTNAVLYALTAASIVSYELLGGDWVVLPLAFTWAFAVNACWHVLDAAVRRTYSPGLATSPIYLVLLYFLVRYGVLDGPITPAQLGLAFVPGAGLMVAMVGGLFLMGRRTAVSRKA